MNGRMPRGRLEYMWLALKLLWIVPVVLALECAGRGVIALRTAWGRWVSRLADWLIGRASQRPPDFVIGTSDRPYLRRWWLIPRNRYVNVYLHEFLRSDNDRALHDHPWANASLLLRGDYIEHTVAAGGIHHRRLLLAGTVRIRLSGRFAHRVELPAGLPCWTLFLTGPRYRQWGFHTQDGWVHWRDFPGAED